MDKAMRNAASDAEGTKITVEDQTQKLARVYLAAGWVVLVVFTVVTGLIYRTVAISRVINAAEGQNIAFAQRFANTIWTEFATLVDDAHDMRGEELMDQVEIAGLGQAILAQVGDLPAVRVSLYTKQGTIVFSTDTFRGIEGELADRDLVASLVPIPTNGRGLEALLQVTQDVTPELQRITRVQMRGMGSVILISTGLLAGALFLMDRRKAIA